MSLPDARASPASDLGTKVGTLSVFSTTSLQRRYYKMFMFDLRPQFLESSSQNLWNFQSDGSLFYYSQRAPFKHT